MRRLAVVLATVAATLGTPLSAGTAGAAGMKVSFTMSGAEQNASVLLIGSNVALKVSATAKSATLSRKFYDSKTKKYSFSVHVVKGDGTYGGPVVFGLSGAKGKYSTNVTSNSSVSLGKVSVKSDGWSKSSKLLKKGLYAKLLRNTLSGGKPRGSGSVGVVKSAGVWATAAAAMAGVTCGTADQTLGTDCDADGVPNAVDVDDNNNGVLDLADQKTSSFESQKLLPWSTLYLEIGGMQKNLNANLANVTTADIDSVMGGATGTFSIAIYLNLPPGESTGYDAVWVDCGTLSYCAKDTGTAVTGPPSGVVGRQWSSLWCRTPLNSGGTCNENYPWREYPGTVFDQSNNGTKVDSSGGAVWNGLTRFVNGSDPVWSGGIVPNVGAGLLDKVKVGDPYVLNLRSSNGTVTQRPMSLGAFFVTVPVVRTMVIGSDTFTVDYTAQTPAGSNSNPFVLGDDGKMTVSFYRPQRAAIDGADAAGTDFVDLGGLRYGFILNAEGGSWSALKASGFQWEIGCASAAGGAYTAVPAEMNRRPDSDPNTEYHYNLWPLTDTFADAPPDPTRFVTVTFDMKACIAELRSAPASRRAVVDATSTRRVPVQLTAVGVDLSGGASRAAQTFFVTLPSSASGW
ncbi:MAG: hypothetical protein ACKOFF_05770 [Acidimicrobiales bacterium]